MKENKFIESEQDKKYFVKRLNVVGGQINGVARMIEEERNYEEILIQISALTNSLKTIGRGVLENYMQNHLDASNKKEIEETINLFNKLV